jgi:argonaute-like protein
LSLAITAEIFPVLTSRIPTLRAFRVLTAGTAPTIAGGRLSYRLRKLLGGIWLWSGSRIVTDSTVDNVAVHKALEGLWNSQPTVFGEVRDVQLDASWRTTSQSIADYVAVGIVNSIDSELRQRLPTRIDLGPIWAERIYDARGWDVAGHPAVSISVSSRLVHKQHLADYLKGLSAPDQLLGLGVYDLFSSLKGEIDEVVGPLGDHRARLLGFSPRPEIVEILAGAPNEDLVVHVGTGRLGYDYAVATLGIIVRVSDFGRFGVNPKKALSSLKIAPATRYGIVLALAGVLESRGIVGQALRSDRPGGEALKAFAGLPDFALRFGGGASQRYESRALLRGLAQHGLFRVSPRFANEPIRIGVLDFVGTAEVSPFLDQVTRQIRGLHMNGTLSEVRPPKGLSRADLEEAIDRYQGLGLDLLLAFFPESSAPDEDDEGDGWGPYRNLKSLAVGRGIPSQVVARSTLSKPFAVANVVLGILGKTGNIPFTLSKPLSGIDLVVGLDIARERKVRLPGSVNATAIARIYLGDGEFLRYVIHDTPLEGETIPEGVLQGLFPRRDFHGKRVIIHRDGYFRGREKEALERWGRSVGATFHLVEIIKSGSPRLYGTTGTVIMMPEKGMMLRLSEKEALVVSSLPPFRDATPLPLHIRTDGSIDLEKAVESILALTLLHYGSVLPPRLPVTIHYSDRIAYLALRGIKPKDLEGSVPFWL